MRLINVFSIVTSLVLSASLHAQSMTVTSTDARVFEFSATHSGKRMLEGTLTVFKDSMVVTPESGQCVIAPYGDDVAKIARFKCTGGTILGDVMLSFERSAPDHATWSGYVQKMATRQQECTQTIRQPPTGAAVATSPPRCTPIGGPPVASGPPSTVSGRMKVTAKK